MPKPNTQQLQPPQEGWEDESRKEAASKAGNVMSVPVLLARSRHITCRTPKLCIAISPRATCRQSHTDTGAGGDTLNVRPSSLRRH